MPTCSYFLVKRGTKYLHLDPTDGISWGRRKGAFCFFSSEAAAQVSCALTTSKAKINILECEGE